MGFDVLARLLIEHEVALVDAQDMGHSTPLHVAAFAGNNHMCATLVEAGASVDATDLSGNTPLHRATLEGHADVMQVLLAHGANANMVGTEGSTPLHFAALAAPVDAQVELAELLLSYGADPLLTNRHGDSASNLALFQGRQQLARVLNGVAPVASSASAASTASAISTAIAATSSADAEDADALERTQDDFLYILGCLQSPGLRRVLLLFHTSHHHKFVKLSGGDYPLELTGLHAQYAGLVSRHIERQLALRGLTWEAASRTCERAAYDGRCSALRLGLLQQLAALEDFEGFYELMASPALPPPEVGAASDAAAAANEFQVDDAGGALRVEEEEEEEEAVQAHAAVDQLAATIESSLAVGSTATATPRSTSPSHATPRGLNAASTLEIALGGSVALNAHRASRRVSRDTVPTILGADDYAPSVGLYADDGAYTDGAPTATPSNFPSCSATAVLDARTSTMNSSAEDAADDGASSSGIAASAISGLSATSGASSFLMNGFDNRPVRLEGSLERPDGSVSDGAWTRGKRIGVGSSGEVFLVRDDESSFDFAAKLVVPRDADAVTRLEEEIELTRHLRHPHIVHHIGTALSNGGAPFSGGGPLGGGDRYLLLEYCSGGSVRQLLDGQYPRGMPSETLHSFGVQLLSGLHFLHEHLIIHRDLKGENLLLVDSEHRHVKIADFGSSHAIVGGHTLTRDVASIRGSPYWMSPEHIQGARCGRKADIWSFACVLLEMATGVPPWTYAPSGGTAAPAAGGAGSFAVFALLNTIVSATGPPPMPFPAELPPGLHELLLDCFNRDLEHRPTTAELLKYSWIALESFPR